MADPSPTGVRNGLEAGEDSCPNPPSAGEGSAWAWLNGLAEVALLGCEKEKPLFCPKADGAFCPKGVLAGGCPNPPGPLPMGLLPPNEKVEGDGAGDASLPNPEPNELPFCAPNPELFEFSGGAMGLDPNPFPPLLAPKENPEPLLAALKEEPFVVAGTPPRIGLESILSSSNNFAVGVVGPLGNTNAGTPVEPAFPPAGAPKENPLLVGAGAPKLNEPPGVCVPLGVASPGVPNEKDGVVDDGAAALSPKLKPLFVVGVVWLANGLLLLLFPAEKENPPVCIGVTAGVVDAAGGPPNVNGAAELDDAAGTPKEKGVAEGVTDGVVDFGLPKENPVCAIGVAAGVVDAPKEKALSLVGVLSSTGAPRESAFTGLGDSDPNENGLDCGVVLGFTAGVVLGNENNGFTGDGVAGVVDTGNAADGVGVVAILGCPNEKGARAAFGSGVAACGAGAILPKEKGFGAAFGASCGGGETDNVGKGAPNENGLAAAGASLLAGSAAIGGRAVILGSVGKVNPEVEPGMADFVVPGAGRKLNPEVAGFGASSTTGAGVAADPKENGVGAGAGGLLSAKGTVAKENGDDAGLLSATGAVANEKGDGLCSAGAGALGNEKGDDFLSSTGLDACAGTGVKPKDVGAAGAFAFANGFKGRTGAWEDSCVMGVMLKAPRTLDSVGVVDIISLASESVRLNDSLVGLIFMGCR